MHLVASLEEHGLGKQELTLKAACLCSDAVLGAASPGRGNIWSQCPVVKLGVVAAVPSRCAAAAVPEHVPGIQNIPSCAHSIVSWPVSYARAGSVRRKAVAAHQKYTLST